MNDPRAWGRASDVLANPQIDPDHWEEELPAFFEAARSAAGLSADHMREMLDYYQRAELPKNILKELETAVEAQYAVSYAFLNSRGYTKQWLDGFRNPFRDKTGDTIVTGGN